jgi:hypothetical protein
MTELQCTGQDDWGLPIPSKQDDVRRLGCILYWILSQGQSHPFGTSERRPENLKNKKYELKNISAESYNLIWSMIDRTVPCSEVVYHPFFWTGTATADFFLTAHDFIFVETSEVETFPISPTVVQDSDLRSWFVNRGGIPQDSHSALKSFISGVSLMIFFIVRHITGIFNFLDRGI